MTIYEVSIEDFVYYVGLMNQKNSDSKNLRIPICSEFIDQDFVEVRKALFHELAKRGNKEIYVMKAY